MSARKESVFCCQAYHAGSWGGSACCMAGSSFCMVAWLMPWGAVHAAWPELASACFTDVKRMAVSWRSPPHAESPLQVPGTRYCHAAKKHRISNDRAVYLLSVKIASGKHFQPSLRWEINTDIAASYRMHCWRAASAY